MRKTGTVPVFLIVAAAPFVLYWRGLRYPLVFDDYHLSAYALKTRYAEAASHLGARWLSDASFAWVNALFGADVAWQRLVNVSLHALCALALFGLLARLFAAAADEPRARPLALFGALWLTLHPVAVYGVAYLMQRSILMATLFSLLALRATLEGLLSRRAWWYALAAACYLLALSSKEHAVMLPAVAAALAVLVRGPGRGVLRSVGWALALLGAASALVVAQKPAVLGAAYEPFLADVASPVSWSLSALNQMAFFFRYLGTWLAPWPGWMAIDVRAALTESPAVLAGAIAWLAWPVAGAVLLMQRGRAGLAGLAMLAPWLLALPELATIRVQEPFVLYRSYLWMALLPAFLPLVRPRRWHAVGAAVLLIAFSGAAWERLGTFSSAAALWEDALKKTDPAAPFAERAWIGRGLAHLGAGRAESARADFERALEINPRAPEAWLGRGTLRLRAGRLDEAIADFDRALALDAKYASAYNKRCVARAGLGLERDALADCERALALDPADDEAWINAGTLQRSLGQRTRAVASYRHALEIRPSSGSAHFNYAVLLMESGAQAEAEGHLSAACSARVAEACAILRGK